MKIKKFLKKYWFILIVLCLAFTLRIYQYYEFPVYGETADELAWSYLGSSLIEERVPGSWSHFDVYKKNGAVIAERPSANLVQPVLDNPPLFGLIPGLAHRFQGHWTNEPSVKMIRFPMIFLGIFNIWLLFLYLNKTSFSQLANKLIILIFAIAPSFVFASRLAIAENLLITWSLLALIRLKKEHTSGKIDLILVLLSILAVLTKVSGLCLPAALFLIGLKERKNQLIRSGLIGALLGIISFCLYGLVYDWQIFYEIQFLQAGREIGLATFFNRFFLHPYLVGKFFIDGWIILGWLGLLITAFLKKNDNQINRFFILFLVQTFFISLAAGEQTFHGWYDYVNFPFYAIAGGLLIDWIINNKQYLLFSFLWLLLLPSIRLFLVHVDIYSEISPLFIRIISVLGFFPFLINLKNNKMAKRVSLVLIGVILLVNILTIFNFEQIAYWENDAFFYYR